MAALSFCEVGATVALRLLCGPKMLLGNNCSKNTHRLITYFFCRMHKDTVVARKQYSFFCLMAVDDEFHGNLLAVIVVFTFI
jgi:hypothetical protein